MATADTRFRTASSLDGHPWYADWPTYLAFAILAASLYLLATEVGLAITIAVAIAWVVLGVPYAIAIGHVLLVALLAPTLADLILAEAGFVAILLASTIRSASPAHTILATLLALILVGAITAATLALSPTWVAALTLIATTMLIAYAIHRIGLVTLGLVDAGEHP